MIYITEPRTAIPERAAAFFEQELMLAKKELQLSPVWPHIARCLKECSETGKSFTAEFSKVKLEDNWRLRLLPIAERAEKRLQLWIDENKIEEKNTAAHLYRYIDEHGRAYRQVSLAAEKEDKGLFYKVAHLPSPDDKSFLFVPLFGWNYTEDEMMELAEQDQIAYGQYPWDTAYEKGYLVEY